MKNKLLGLLSIALLAGATVSSADNASFTYSDSADNNLAATFTLSGASNQAN